MVQFIEEAKKVTNDQMKTALKDKVNSIKDNELREKMMKKLAKINKDFFQLTKAEKSEILNK
jgi:isopenicillin N synthase-like dioxygenase